jgi:lipoyl(octanoyl) transferase
LYLYDLKNIDYDTSLIIQEEIHAYVKNKNISGVILSLEYPNLFTIGKSGKKSDILISQNELNLKGIKVYESNRGGEITYHGPGQIIYYPIINLKKLSIKPVEYIRILQRTVISSLKDFNIQAEDVNKPVGVWVNGKKISSIGVRISKSVTMHGVAINLNCDLKYFTYIIPCGIKDLNLTNINNETNLNCDKDSFSKTFSHHLNNNFFN